MNTLAVVDIGSNSIKVAVWDRLSGREISRAAESVRLFPAAAGDVVLSNETIEAGAQAVAKLVAVARERKADPVVLLGTSALRERKSTRLNSSHLGISHAVHRLKKKNTTQ